MFGKKRAEAKKRKEEFFSYFKVEMQENGDVEAVADITDDDIKRWLYNVTRAIQQSFTRKGIENYLSAQMTIGGQKIEFSFLKDFKEGPHALRRKAEAERDELKKRVEELELQLKEKNE